MSDDRALRARHPSGARPAEPADRSRLRRGGAWERWKELAARAATFQARVLLTVFYWVVVPPFGVQVRFLGDPLDLGREGGRWRRPPDSEPSRQH